MKGISKKYNKNTRNKKRKFRKGTKKINKKGRGIFKKLFRKDLRESLISKKSRKKEEYSEMSTKELIENVVLLLGEAEKVDELENLLIVYRDFFDKDNITTLIAGLTEAMYFQSKIGTKESVKIKQEYRELIDKLKRLLENIS